jgi:transcription factor C subunit 6
VEYFSLLFHNRTKVIFYLKARSYKQYLAVAPFPSRSHSPDIGRKVKRLGGTFEDGAFAIYAVPDRPDPSDMVSPDHDQSYPVCGISNSFTIQATHIHAFILLVKLPHPILRIELEETSCWSFNWANSELIAIGTTNGTLSCELLVYDY